MDPCFCLCFLPFVSCFLLLLFSWLCSLKRGIRRDFFGTKRSYPYLPGKYIMNVTQNLMDRLRPLVGSKGWDYCVFWKLSEDQRYIELVDCCCAGTDDDTQNGGEELQFHVSSVLLLPCRDVMFQHPRTKSCALLAQLPSSMPLDSGMYAQTLMSNLPGWLNFCDSSDSTVVEVAVGTRVLIPVAGGLVELFVAKQVSEDQQIIDFVTSECNFLMDQETMINSTNMHPGGFPVINVNEMIGEHNPKPFSAGENDQKDHIIHFQQPQPASPLDLPYDFSVDQIRASNSPVNFLQQFSYNREENKTKMVFPEVGNELQDVDEMHKSMNNHTENASMRYVDSLASREQLQGNDKDSEKQENGRSGDAISDCSHQMDDELDDTKYRRRGGKGPQAKNLMAERKRRKKLNERLHTLRSLVPNISKLDKASILVDAIDYVKQLQKQVKELQDELEENSDDEGARNGNLNNIRPEILNHSGVNLGPNSESALNSFHLGADVKGSFSKPNQHQESEITHDHDHKGPQMEPQVEVAQINGKEFFLKVFCEHKPGGFVRLMEALEALGLEVTNANVTSFRNLVSNVFKVEKKNCEMLQADYVRDSLLEATRHSPRVWPEMPKASDQDYNGVEYNHHQHHSQLLHNDHITCNHHQLHHSVYS